LKLSRNVRFVPKAGIARFILPVDSFSDLRLVRS